MHEYGGGAFLVGPDGEVVYFSNFVDQRLYKQAVGSPVCAEAHEYSHSLRTDCAQLASTCWLSSLPHGTDPV